MNSDLMKFALPFESHPQTPSPGHAGMFLKTKYLENSQILKLANGHTSTQYNVLSRTELLTGKKIKGLLF